MKQQRPLTIEGGQLVTPAGVQGGALRLVDGCIDGIGTAAQDGDEVIDAGGALVAPGLVDLGVFAIDKPAFHFGGITRAALMPDNGPLDGAGLVERAAKAGKPDLWVHPLAAATKCLAGTELAEIGLMKQAGARAIATVRPRDGRCEGQVQQPACLVEREVERPRVCPKSALPAISFPGIVAD